jgi:hypothetical protein
MQKKNSQEKPGSIFRLEGNSAEKTDKADHHNADME